MTRSVGLCTNHRQSVVILTFWLVFQIGLLCFANVDYDVEDGQREFQDLDNELRGHLKTLGSHRPAEGSVKSVSGFLHPKKFFADHVHRHTPIIFREAAKDMEAFEKWTDDYLIEKYGSVLVSVEVGKKENRSEQTELMPLAQFLQVYRTENLYMIQDITKPFHEDLSLPSSLRCGGFQKCLEVGVIWFSSGDTKSVLHNDELDNINCLLDGQKRFILIDKELDYLVEAEGWEVEGTYSHVDVEAVDLHQYPSLSQVTWWYADLQAGDCLFIPYRWYHSVSSYPGRNLAVNLFFAHRLWLDEDDCEDMEATASPVHDSLANYKINSLHPESSATEKMRCDIFEVFEGEPDVDLELAADLWANVAEPDEIQAIFEVMDTDKDLVLSWKEIYAVDVLELLVDFPYLLPEDLDDLYDQPRSWEMDYPPSGRRDEL